jgi:hypothetical protein
MEMVERVRRKKRNKNKELNEDTKQAPNEYKGMQ